jgi:hypothetical protein
MIVCERSELSCPSFFRPPQTSVLGLGFFPAELPTPPPPPALWGRAAASAWITPIDKPIFTIRKRTPNKSLKYLNVTGKKTTGRGKIPVDTGKKRLALLPKAANHLAVIGKNHDRKMDDTGNTSHSPLPALKSKRGFKRYDSNPSVPIPGALPTRTKRIEVPGGKASVIVDNTTGELRGIGGMGIWWNEEVDKGRFVKLFLEGIKQAAGLSKAGMMVFEVVYNQIRDNPGKDKIELNYYLACKYGLEMPERTFRHGLRQLLEKEFIYESMVSDVFFVNIRYMFNGDRLAFVRTYHVKKPADQEELPLEAALPALPAPEAPA